MEKKPQSANWVSDLSACVGMLGNLNEVEREALVDRLVDYQQGLEGMLGTVAHLEDGYQPYAVLAYGEGTTGTPGTGLDSGLLPDTVLSRLMGQQTLAPGQATLTFL